MAIAGKVAITPKGEWNSQTAYTKLDLVFYENASYVAIQPSTGVEPTNESYWMLMVQSAGGADLEAIIDGTTQVGNAKTLDGHSASEVGESGARNLIPYPYKETSKNVNGVNVVHNEDGSVTLNGTSTAITWVLFQQYSIEFCETLKKFNKLTMSDGITSKRPAWMYVFGYDENKTQIYSKNLTGTALSVEIIPDESWYTVSMGIYIPANAVLENLTFRPMLEVGGIAHDFVPYHLGGAEDAKNADTVDGYHAYELQAYSTVNNSPLDSTARLEWQNGYMNLRARQNTEGTLFKTHVDDADTLDGLDSTAFVKTTGGTMNGPLNIDSPVFGANVRSTSLEKGTLPSGIGYISMNFMEKGGTLHKNRIGQIQTSVDSSGKVQTTLSAYKFEKDGSTAQVVGVVCDPDGTGYGYAPHPSNPKDNSNKIATTKWVNDFALARTGGTVTDANNVPFGIKNTVEDTVFMKYVGKTGDLGSIGFASKDLPVYRATDGVTQYALLHKGNASEYLADTESGTFTLKMQGVTLGTGTYYRVGKMIHCKAIGQIPQAFEKGYLSLTGFPFAITSKNGSIASFHTHNFYGGKDNVIHDITESTVTVNSDALSASQPFVFRALYITE